MIPETLQERMLREDIKNRKKKKRVFDECFDDSIRCEDCMMCEYV